MRLLGFRMRLLSQQSDGFNQQRTSNIESTGDHSDRKTKILKFNPDTALICD